MQVLSSKLKFTHKNQAFLFYVPVNSWLCWVLSWYSTYANYSESFAHVTKTKANTNLTSLTVPNLISQLQFKDSDLASSVYNTAKTNQWLIIDEFKSLTCHKEDLYWLDGIEKLQALTRLDVKSEILDRFTALSPLSNITHLSIDAYRFNDFSVLANMQQLTHLTIHSHVALSPDAVYQLLPNLQYADIC